jgi:hypothetical protein
MAPHHVNTLASPQVTATSDDSRLIGSNNFASSDSDSSGLTRPITPAIRDIMKDFELANSALACRTEKLVNGAKLERVPMRFRQ